MGRGSPSPSLKDDRDWTYIGEDVEDVGGEVCFMVSQAGTLVRVVLTSSHEDVDLWFRSRWVLRERIPARQSSSLSNEWLIEFEGLFRF